MRAIRSLAAPAEVSLRLGWGGVVVIGFAATVLSEGPFFRFPFGSGEAWGLEVEASGFVAPGGGALTSGKKGAIAQEVMAAMPA